MWKRRNKPMRTIPRQWESCFGILYLSFGIGIAVDFIINIPLGLIMGQTGTLLHNLLYFISVPIAQFVLSYQDGRRNYQFKLGRLLIALLLTLVTQVALVIVIDHAIYFSGPSIVFDHYMLNVYNPVEVPTRTVLDTYEWILMFAADLLIYFPTMIVGEYLGAKKHEKEFKHEDTDCVQADIESAPTEQQA